MMQTVIDCAICSAGGGPSLYFYSGGYFSFSFESSVSRRRSVSSLFSHSDRFWTLSVPFSSQPVVVVADNVDHSRYTAVYDSKIGRWTVGKVYEEEQAAEDYIRIGLGISQDPDETHTLIFRVSEDEEESFELTTAELLVLYTYVRQHQSGELIRSYVYHIVEGGNSLNIESSEESLALFRGEDIGREVVLEAEAVAHLQYLLDKGLSTLRRGRLDIP